MLYERGPPEEKADSQNVQSGNFSTSSSANDIIFDADDGNFELSVMLPPLPGQVEEANDELADVLETPLHAKQQRFTIEGRLTPRSDPATPSSALSAVFSPGMERLQEARNRMARILVTAFETLSRSTEIGPEQLEELQTSISSIGVCDV